ncbi:MAG TPA: DUF444 family protein [Planctomycetota bacterium]|jgi:hypothetical protein|nr:DUF444 family protein [Planctomycetota bacterium]
MVRKIERDHARFREIVRGRIRKDLHKYITNGELLGRLGKNAVSIPLPQIELPRIRYGPNPKSGVGQGEGAPGTPLDGEGSGNAGDAEGSHILEVEVTLEELAALLGEELGLPRIQPKGTRLLRSTAGVYTGIARRGPESLRHFKRTYRHALKRSIALGLYDPRNPIVIPWREDRRYRSRKVTDAPESSAVILYMMDVSGSMGKEQKEIVRLAAFWIDAWLRSQYRNLEVRYIVHDAVAHVVDAHTFFHLRESGGTKISSAYELALRLVEEKFPADTWNVYAFHFSDGDNWSARDTERCVELLRLQFLSRANLFCYGQVKSAYGSGQFKKDLDGAFGEDERVRTCDIPDREGIPKAIRSFLGAAR